jgi:PAS domain-containing protein
VRFGGDQVTEGKERLERILASIQDAFLSLDARLRYTFVNNNAAILLGAKKEGANLVTLSHVHCAHLPDSRSHVCRQR